MSKISDFFKEIFQNDNVNQEKQINHKDDLNIERDEKNILFMNLIEKKQEYQNNSVEDKLFMTIEEARKQDKKMDELVLEHIKNVEDEDYEFPPIELLNQELEIMKVLSSKEFKENKSKTIIGFKADSNVKTTIDIQETSHILIAGTTGIGKTTLLDNIIVDVLYKAKPNEIKFVMFDTNNNSLRTYNGIPHLLIPVITDVKKAIGALAWVVQEIENRYQVFFNQSVDDIMGYNEKTQENKLPVILVIIDEVSDIINYNKDEIEELLIRITKFGKKAGVFLIISTNRPSTNIISGTIKANIYTRISFFLPAKLDSRLILDVDGAEKLRAHGDMLFKTIGVITPQKYHCPYISLEGIKNIVNFFKRDEVYYNKDILEQIEKKDSDRKELDEIDPFLMDAIDLVVETGQASTSFIQRRLKIGYAQAGRIIDQLEERGIISGYQGSKPREVLMSKERWNELKNIQ